MKKYDLSVVKDIPMLSSVGNIGDYFAQRTIYLKKYTKGETAFRAGDPCTTLDVVCTGSLTAYSLARNGSATTMFEFYPGSILGANLLFADNNVYPLDCFCLTNCLLAHIKKDAVSALLHNYDFVIHYVKSLSQNSQNMNQKITVFYHRTLRENIMDFLIKQCQIQGSRCITLPVSKRELADFLGVQRPSLFRELKKMKEEGLIDIQNRIITIL